METYFQRYIQSSYRFSDHSTYMEYEVSSRNLCVQFFYPLIHEHFLMDFFCLLDLPHHLKDEITYSHTNIQFEKKSWLFKKSEMSDNMYIDFFVRFDSGTKFIFETKYKHDYFHSGARIKNRVERKFDLSYKKQLEDSKVLRPNITREIFVQNFQLIRYLMHIDKDTYFIVLYPETNRVTNRQLSLVNELLLPEWHGHFISLCWEDVLEKLILSLLDRSITDLDSEKFELKQHFSSVFSKFELYNMSTISNILRAYTDANTQLRNRLS